MKVADKKTKQIPTAKKVKITRCKLTKKQQQRMVEFFVLGVTARSAADLMEMQPNTAALFYRKIREIIAYYLAQEAKQAFKGEFVLDESKFNSPQNSQKAIKHPVFGMISQDGRVFTKMTGLANTNLLTSAVPNLVAPDSVVFTDNFKQDQALDVNECYQERVNATEATDQEKYLIGDTENFWNQTKRILRKYNGIPKATFPLFLKECEFRFNYGSPKEQLKTLKQWTGV